MTSSRPASTPTTSSTASRSSSVCARSARTTAGRIGRTAATGGHKNHNHRGRSPGNWRAPLYAAGHSILNLLINAISGSLGSAETVGTIQAAVLYALTLIVVMLLCVRNFLVLL